MTKTWSHSWFDFVPIRSRKVAARKLISWRIACLIFAFCTATAISSAQKLTTLASFDGADGNDPYTMSLVQGFDGNLYGTTHAGGTAGRGNVFKVTPTGVVTLLYSFCSQPNCVDGSVPEAGLVQATDGNLYGMTYQGGNGAGTVFRITASGTLTTLYSFCSQVSCDDGTFPSAALMQASNGKFYGTTSKGGANGYGTVFEVTPAGKLTTLYSFCSQTTCTDGEYPYAGLVQATNGNFYGTTYGGGANGGGTVFELTPKGGLTTLYSFCSQTPHCTDGEFPFAGLVQATNGSFYGTTSGGGANGSGTIFELTPDGKLTSLYSFCSQTHCTDGSYPYAGLVQATDGNFYGTTNEGGAGAGPCGNCGTVFAIRPAGALTTLHAFGGKPDGDYPYGGLVQATNGNLYGPTWSGGEFNDGVVFALTVGLKPFVETLPTSGKAGRTVIILGNNLTGTTSVTFSGTAATFTVVSDTEIKTTVPTGAGTGTVEVITPSSTLKSNVVFRVR